MLYPYSLLSNDYLQVTPFQTLPNSVSDSLCQVACDIVSRCLGVAVTTESSQDLTPEWDSFSHLHILLALEEIIKRQLTQQEALSIRSVKSIASLLAVAKPQIEQSQSIHMLILIPRLLLMIWLSPRFFCFQLFAT